jgi:hypothetical protein
MQLWPCGKTRSQTWHQIWQSLNLYISQIADTFASQRTCCSAGGDSPQKTRAQSSRNASASSAPSSNGSTPAPRKSPFGAAPSTMSPFGDTSMANLDANSEPRNLNPRMAADPVSDAPWWTKITKTQIVLFFTFTAMTLTMLATCVVVFKTGAIHFNSDAY